MQKFFRIILAILELLVAAAFIVCGILLIIYGTEQPTTVIWAFIGATCMASLGIEDLVWLFRKEEK